MTVKVPRRLALSLIFAAAASAAGIVITRADTPGYLFMDLDEGGAAVARPPSDQTKARIHGNTAKLSEDIAAAIANGAQPIGASIILAYRGQLYIVPDKQLEDGKMASEHVMGPASRPGGSAAR
jgi:hypothetical protein